MVSWLTVGCNDDTIQKRDITMEAFSELKAPVFEISPDGDYHVLIGFKNNPEKIRIFSKQSNGEIQFFIEGV